MVSMEQWLKYSKIIALQVQSGMEENGLTQKQLAQRMGCSQQHVSALLKGSSNLTLETIARIEKALGVDLIGSAITHVRGYENSNLYHPVLNEPEAPKYGKTAKARGDGGRTVWYPIGVQTFEKIVEEGLAYVDKTALAYKLAKEHFVFLSRPRRFGKSLLLSTLDSYFSGRRDLFRGLDIDKLEEDWVEYPVLHFDFSGVGYKYGESLEELFDYYLTIWEEQYGIEKSSNDSGLRFRHIIDKASASAKTGVVILIDEYDKPFVENLGDHTVMDLFRKKLKSFYGILKAKEDKIRFCMLTGVSKLGKLSVFSALNNLKDISLDLDYSEICGITEDELHEYFDAGITEMAKFRNMGKDECYREFKKMYDGYHFSSGAQGMYNPFSVLNALSSKRFAGFWYETGTPTFLVEYLRNGGYKLDDLQTSGIPESTLTGANYYEPDPVTLLYQTGYLTIKSYDERFRTYVLDYPNDEVKGGFLQAMSLIYTPLMEKRGDFAVYRFVKDIEAGDVESLMNRFVAFFADSDYQVQGNLELYFQNTFAVMLKMMGMYVQTEKHTSNGRIDVVFDTADYLYVIEIKRDESAAVALSQIKEKGYDKPYLASGKKIYTIGVSFSTETKRIEEWIKE